MILKEKKTFLLADIMVLKKSIMVWKEKLLYEKTLFVRKTLS